MPEYHIMNDTLDNPIETKLSNVGSVDDLAQTAFSQFQYLKKLVRMQGTMFLEIGGILYEIQSRKLYVYLGHPTFVSFINDSDIGISFKTAYSWIRVYRMYIKQFGFKKEELEGVPWSKLEIIMGNLRFKDRSEAEEFIGKAKVLSASDLYQEIREVRAKDGQYDDVPLKYLNPQIIKHKRCGKFYTTIPEDEYCKCSR